MNPPINPIISLSDIDYHSQHNNKWQEEDFLTDYLHKRQEINEDYNITINFNKNDIVSIFVHGPIVENYINIDIDYKEGISSMGLLNLLRLKTFIGENIKEKLFSTHTMQKKYIKEKIIDYFKENNYKYSIELVVNK
jgi:hypothetical protein